MVKLAVDTGILDALAGVKFPDGRIGLDALFGRGDKILITKAVWDEFLLAKRSNSAEITAWFNNNSHRIEGQKIWGHNT